MDLKGRDKDRVAGTWETREKRQGGALSSHPTRRLRWWAVTLVEPAPPCYPPHQPRTSWLAGPRGRAGLRQGPSRSQRASPLQLQLLLIRRGLGRRVSARPGVGQGFPDSHLQQQSPELSPLLPLPIPRAQPCPRPTCSASVPASSRLCWIANCSRSSSSSRRGSLRSAPSTLYPSGTSNTAGSTSHGNGLPGVAEGPRSDPRTPVPASHVAPPSTVVPEAATAEPGAGTHTELRGSSQPHRLPKVMRALSTWKRGISVRRQPSLSHCGHRPTCAWPVRLQLPHSPELPEDPLPLHHLLTNLDWEAGWEAKGDEVAQLGKVSVADGHQVNDGRYLVTQGQRVLLTQPQCSLEPAQPTTGPG